MPCCGACQKKADTANRRLLLSTLAVIAAETPCSYRTSRTLGPGGSYAATGSIAEGDAYATITNAGSYSAAIAVIAARVRLWRTRACHPSRPTGWDLHVDLSRLYSCA